MLNYLFFNTRMPRPVILTGIAFYMFVISLRFRIFKSDSSQNYSYGSVRRLKQFNTDFMNSFTCIRKNTLNAQTGHFDRRVNLRIRLRIGLSKTALHFSNFIKQNLLPFHFYTNFQLINSVAIIIKFNEKCKSSTYQLYNEQSYLSPGDNVSRPARR